MIPTFLASTLAADPLPKSPPSDDFWMPLDASTFGAQVDPLYHFLLWLSIISAAGSFTVWNAKSQNGSFARANPS